MASTSPQKAFPLSTFTINFNSPSFSRPQKNQGWCPFKISGSILREAGQYVADYFI